MASGLLGDKVTREQTAALTRETLGLIGLEAHASKSIGTLSGGQLQRALLGRAIISNPGLLVLDEPLSYVDKQFEHYIYDLWPSCHAPQPYCSCRMRCRPSPEWPTAISSSTARFTSVPPTTIMCTMSAMTCHNHRDTYADKTPS